MGRITRAIGNLRSKKHRWRWRIATPSFLIGLFAVVGWLNSHWIDDQIEAFRIDRLIERGDLEEARAHLAIQIHRYPARPRPRFLLATVERRLGRITGAEEILQRAVELGLPVAEASREHALLAARFDFPTAEPGLIRTLARNPGDLEVHQALAGGYLRSARWDAAVAACTAWLASDPSSVDATLGRARGLRSLGRLNSAIADCRSILARSPDHLEARLALAEILIEAKRADEARAEVARCRAQAPDRPEPLVILAACSSARGDLGAATSTLEVALKQAPNFVPALRALSSAHQARGRDDLARPLLDRSRLLDLDRGAPQVGSPQPPRRSAPPREE